MVLFELVASFCPPEHITVVYFDHRIRSSTSKDKEVIRRKCKQLGVRNFILGSRRGEGLSENALRIERHAFLKKAASEVRAHYILLGHQAHDQLETLFMRLIRGTSLEGLAGIEKRQGNVLRPLLGFTKEELKRYAKTKNVDFIEDETNLSDLYLRNRIRNQILPLLVKAGRDFGGENALVLRIAQLTEELKLIKLRRKKWVEKWVFKHVNRTPFWWSFSFLDWSKLELDQKRLVSRYLWKKLTKESLQLKEIIQLEETILKRKSTTLSGKVQVEISFDRIFLVSEQHRRKIEVKDKKVWDWCCELKDQGELKRNLKTLKAELRFLAPGDRFKNKKMKKIVHELGISRPQRALVPVVAKKGTTEIIWHFPLSGQLSQWIKAPWEKIEEQQEKTF